MKLKLLVLFLFFLAPKTSSAQYKQMLHKPYKEKVEDIALLFENTINLSREDSSFTRVYAQEMAQWARANGDLELVLEAKLLEAYTFWFLDGHKDPSLLEGLIIIANADNINDIPHIEARAVHVIARHYWESKSYEKAFEWLLRLESILDEMEPESFPNMAEHLNYIGRCYFYFEDYQSALTYYGKSSELKKTAFNSNSVIEAQSTVGLCYQKLGELITAENYFLAVINDSSQYASPIWKAIASGNLGYNYYLQERYDRAIPLFLVDIQSAISINEYGLAAGSLIPLADIYLKQQKFRESKQKIEQAKTFIQRSGQTDRLWKLYPIMSKWYVANKQADSSAAYLDSAMLALNAYNKKYSALKLMRANQKVEAKERLLQIEKLQTESTLKLTKRNFIIIVITILLIGSMITLWFRNKYLIKRQELRDLMHASTQTALGEAKIQLKNLTLKVREDNEMIFELKKNEDFEENQNLISNLKSKSILTHEDWVQYQNLFNKVYPFFSTSVTTYYPYLSQAELRCIYLEKLQLSNNEMALVLGVSSNTVRVTQHRIRKKMNIESQEELEALIQKF